MSLGRVVFRGHAIKRMFQRRIGGTDVRRVLESGETIETYPQAWSVPGSTRGSRSQDSTG
ncbi:MAG: DUF4258 domain-containing protein [Nitrospirae bacterium]|nr:DUF4258 domain-containing protein [Nitrospirota bacterium]